MNKIFYSGSWTVDKTKKIKIKIGISLLSNLYFYYDLFKTIKNIYNNIITIKSIDEYTIMCNELIVAHRRNL